MKDILFFIGGSMQQIVKHRKSYWQFLAWAIGSKGESGLVAYFMAVAISVLLVVDYDAFFTQKSDGFIVFILYPLSLYVVLVDHYRYFWRG